MARLVGFVAAALLVAGAANLLRASGDDVANAILEKAIKALGGEARLGKAKAVTWKGKGTISFGGNDNEFTTESTVSGLDRFRGVFEGEFGGNKVMGVTVLAGDKGWRKIGDNQMELDKDGVANEKRTVYLQVLPMLVLPLKDKAFKIEAAGEEKVGDKAAVAIKVTPVDGKTFRLSFDKQSGLPVKVVAKVIGFMGEEFTQETTYGDYKDFKGIKKATKIESKRDGEKFLDYSVTDFRVLDKVDAKMFSEPE
jgi:hypothetical protein